MIDYWKEKEKEALETATSLDELADIALSVLSRMPQPIAEICGPMSTGGAGDLKANMKRYKIAINVLAQVNENMSVFDPSLFQAAMVRITKHLDALLAGSYKTDILDIFYHRVFTSGHIKKAYFLPDWESSFGASWERKLVETLPIEVADFPEDAFVKVLNIEKEAKK